ncbi:MAG: thioredoxin [Gemmatimonadales bacterium]
MVEMMEVTEETFEAEVGAHPGLTIVDFWAAWCGPCKAIAPVLEQIAAERGDAIRVVKVNADEHPKIGMRLNVRGVPTLLFFKGGLPVDRIVGAVPKARIDEVVGRHIGVGVLSPSLRAD